MAIQTPRGTRDFMPGEMIRREYLLEMVKMVFHDYGFQPMETPAFESWELLGKKGGGGEAVKDEVYTFRDKAKREMGLRFDLTVPMARVIAANPQLPKPFKRYQIGRVWRYDRPQAGRYREFWQADADIIGSSWMDAEAECIAVAVNGLMQLGFRKLKVRLNNRKILNGVMELAGVKKAKQPAVMRALDKLEKIGEKAVMKELSSVIKPAQTKKIMKGIGKKGPASRMLKEVKELKESSTAMEGISELRELVKKAKAYGIEKMIEVDLSLVRGLDYYTGPIFEISIGSERNLGSVAGGGRYDSLVELYGGKWTPAVGISLGIERIYEIMEEQGMFSHQHKTRTEMFMVTVDDSMREPAIRLAQELRASFVNVETDLMNRDMKKQLKHVNSSGIPFAVIVGPAEMKKGRFTIKDMRSGKEVGMTAKQLVKKFGKG